MCQVRADPPFSNFYWLDGEIEKFIKEFTALNPDILDLDNFKDHRVKNINHTRYSRKYDIFPTYVGN